MPAEQVHAQDVTVGQVLQIRTNQRVPADVVLLRTSERSGDAYVRTDQLDGETEWRSYLLLTATATTTTPTTPTTTTTRTPTTYYLLLTTYLLGENEWKLRRAVPATQGLCATDRALSACDGMLFAPRPSADTHEFSGHLVLYDSSLEGGSVQERAYSLLCLLPAMPTPCYGATRYRSTTPAFYGSTFLCLLVLQARLGLEHTMWANSVLASGTATGVVIHTGRETRAAANSARPRMKTKIGSIDLQVNTLAKLLFALTLLTALVMVSVPLLLRWLEYGLKFERETQSLLTQQLLQASLIVSIVSRPMPMPTSKYV